MLEFNLFLIDYWYFSVPLFLSIVLWFRSETRRGGNRIDCSQLTNLVNKQSARLLDVRPRSCKMVRNAAIAGEKMQKYGYKETHILQGGISTWQQEGLPLVKVK